MPEFAASLTVLCIEVDFLDRFDAAATSEFSGVEYLFPQAYPKKRLAKDTLTLSMPKTWPHRGRSAPDESGPT